MAKKIALDLDIKSASAGEAVTRTKTLKQELRELKQELQTMDEASPDFLKIAKAAGDIEDKIKATNEQVAAFASPANERALNGILDISTGIAGGFAAVQGAAALFGSENEDLQKAILKTQAAMSLLNGIIAIQNVLKKESAANTLLLSAAEKAAAITTRLLALATTGLQKALIATGFGAIIVLIGTLIANFDKLKAAMQTATSQARKYAESQEEIAKNSLEKIENFDEEARSLRRLGLEENEIARRRRENFAISIKDQEDLLKKQQELVTSIQDSFKNVETWEKFGFGLIPRLFFGDEKDVEDAKKRAEEIKKQIEKLENDRFDFEEKIKKDNSDREKSENDKKQKENQDAVKKAEAARVKNEERRISTINDEYTRELAALRLRHEQERKLALENGESLAILKKVQNKEKIDLEAKFTQEIDKIIAEEKKTAMLRLLSEQEQEKKILELAAEDKLKIASKNAEAEKLIKDNLQKDLDAIDAKYKLERETTEKEAALKKEEEDKKIKEKQLADEKEYAASVVEVYRNIEDSKLQIATMAASFLQEVAGQNKALAMAALVVEKGAAIANVLISTQREIAAYYLAAASRSALSGGTTTAFDQALAAKQALFAKARAGVAIATITASGINGARSIGSGGQAPNAQSANNFGNVPTGVGSGLDTRAFTQGQTRVYVVENDITRAQRRVAQIRENAIID